MLDVNPETVDRLIQLAREFHAQEAVSFPETSGSPGEDWVVQVLADHESDATLQEFLATVSDLEPDQQDQLVALLWLGRGDYELDDWSEAVDEAHRNASQETGRYLIAHPMLADFLREGLVRHGYEGE